MADGLRIWLAQLGRMLDRYRTLLPAQAHLMLLSETAAPALLDPRSAVDANTAVGLSASAEAGWKLAGLGGWLLAGPQAAPGAAALPVNSLDLHAQLLGLLGLPAASGASQIVDWQALGQAAAFDADAIDWLARHELPAAELGAMRARAALVQAQTLAAWAAARTAQGEQMAGVAAVAALRQALVLMPAASVGLQLMLAQSLLSIGQRGEAQALLAAMPPPAQDPVLVDLIAALRAEALGDAAAAGPCWQRLIEFAPRPVAAIAARWYGRTLLAQGDAAGAEALLAAALREDATEGEAWLDWDQACRLLGRGEAAAAGLALARAILPGLARLMA
jgi:tetratricopeptide (TPR) repeat protein